MARGKGGVGGPREGGVGAPREGEVGGRWPAGRGG